MSTWKPLSLARVLLHELLQPQSFPELSQRLKSVQKQLQEEWNSMKPPCCFGLEDTLTVLQVEDIPEASVASGGAGRASSRHADVLRAHYCS